MKRYSYTFSFIVNTFFIGMVVGLGFSPVFGDKIAITQDNKKVLLKDDGTWIYMDENAQKTDSISKDSQASKSSANSQLVDIIRANGKHDFRNTDWGASLGAVKKSETLKLINESKDTLKYEFLLLNLKCYVAYLFKQDKLVGAQYSIVQNYINPAIFQEDFVALKKYLMQLYKAPVSEQDAWKNDMYKNDESQWGFAVSIGFLTRYVVWRDTRTKIGLTMSGENHQINTVIKYQSL